MAAPNCASPEIAKLGPDAHKVGYTTPDVRALCHKA